MKLISCRYFQFSGPGNLSQRQGNIVNKQENVKIVKESIPGSYIFLRTRQNCKRGPKGHTRMTRLRIDLLSVLTYLLLPDIHFTNKTSRKPCKWMTTEAAGTAYCLVYKGCCNLVYMAALISLFLPGSSGFSRVFWLWESFYCFWKVYC